MRRIAAPVTLVLAVFLTQVSASAHLAATVKRRPPCGAPEAALLLTQFLSAFNRGNQRQLDRVFAHANRFSWFSVSGAPGERLDPDARDRASLLAYFATRHAAGEQLALVSATYLRKARGFFDFTYRLSRSASDFAAPSRYGGKAAVVCFGGPPAIAVWSMGPEPS
jgi:hypothetical protein